MTRTMLPTMTNAKKPNTIDAPIANVPTTITKILAMGFPAGNPLVTDEYFNVKPSTSFLGHPVSNIILIINVLYIFIKLDTTIENTPPLGSDKQIWDSFSLISMLNLRTS